MGSHIFTIDKAHMLCGDNYFVWKIRIKAEFMVRKLWDIVDGKEKQPIGRNINPNLVSSFNNRSQEALSILLRSVGDDFLLHIGNIELPFEAWKLL